MLKRFGTMPYALFLPLIPIVLLSTVALVHPMPYYQMPEQIPFWLLVFGLPHILSSFQTMYDKEYLTTYKKQSFVILGLFILPFVVYKVGIPIPIIHTVLFALTVHHIVAQQYGVCLSVAQVRPSLISKICKWCTVILGVIVYFRAYLSPNANNAELYDTFTSLANTLHDPLLLIIAITSSLLIWQSRYNKVGAAMIAFNTLLLIIALTFIFDVQYQLIGFMIFRILHDTTGFVVYINHDINRNKNVRKNLVYRLFPHLPIWLLNIVFAFTLAATLNYLAGYINFITWLIVGIAIAHYYMEGVIWRGGTPHRNHLNLSGAQ